MEKSCVDCEVFACRTGDFDNKPEFCPMKTVPETLERSKKLYEDPADKKILREFHYTQAEGFMKMCRVQETMLFAKKMDMKKLGIAYCLGLKNEAKILAKVLRGNGFEVFGVACKVWGVPKEEMGLGVETKLRPKQLEPICNPIAQAEILNQLKTDFNIIVGLGPGDDYLFMKHSKAPSTTLIVKDRVLAHNSAAALYTSESFYHTKLYNEPLYIGNLPTH